MFAHVRSGVAMLTAYALAALLLADLPRSTPESVRATIKQLWSNKPDEVGQAYERLEGDPLALPVLRRAIATDPDVVRRAVLEKIVASCLARRDKGLAKLVDQWAGDGRLDLLTEVRSTTDGNAADAALTHLIAASQSLRQMGGETLTARLPSPPSDFLDRLPWADRAAFDQSKATPQFDAEHVLPEKESRKLLALFAARIAVPSEDIFNSVMVARSDLTHLSATGRSRLKNSLLFVNAPLQLQQVTGCVVVVDGDLELFKGGGLTGCLLVVNGSVTDNGKLTGPAFWKCVLWATGDIEVKRAGGPPHQSVFLAGGKVPNGVGLAREWCTTEDVVDPPLPVRFLDPAADYGLTVEAVKEGLKVSKVADKSGFAEYLKAGDVIAAVTGLKTTTAPAFRRELRRGFIEGAVLLDVTRGKEKVELLVPVPDIPPVPKRNKMPKPKPPEKK